ncbi:MAG: hypothetical protein CVV03_07725 [Firmicutes bacterium HGW-Firmicutes-8]|nr:MAG: hypothetical protein CVV03_07725 [Firmicutes bacterium HGW-Firmicutes-8]
MKDLLVCIYMAKINNCYRAFMTHNPQVDARILLSDGRLDLLTPFIPVGVAYYILKTVFTEEEIKGCDISHNGKPLLSWFKKTPSYSEIVCVKSARVTKLLKQIDHFFGEAVFLPKNYVYPRQVFFEELPAEDEKWNDRYVQSAVKEALKGRILFLEELEKSLVENGFKTNANIMDVLQVLALRDRVEIMPSLGFTAPGEAACFRCGHKINFPGVFGQYPEVYGYMYHGQCPQCKLPSLYCENCNVFGESRLCRGLFALDPRSGGNKNKHGLKYELSGVTPLTDAQNRAARELVDFVKENKTNECLIWAVCGAGKTEVVLKAMAEVLNSGGSVLYAIPRRDVVKELSPRLKKSFGNCDIVTSYGGSEEKFRSAPIVIATTHQALRYYRQFDLVILDEVDAYPYRDNHMLHVAVKRAAKPGGHTVYLTATPDEKVISQVNRGLAKLITIPARYHGHPVPEPQCTRLAAFQKSDGRNWSVAPYITELLYKWLVENDGQVFAFLPTIQMVETFGPILEKTVTGWAKPKESGLLRFSHSKDPFRDQKIEDFKAGKFRLFLTTTIMERGITVNRANVLVIHADFDKVFDEGTLIQMAGRAGRSAEFPHGEAVFVGRTINKAMKNAIKKIRYLNSVARQEGYLENGE